VVEARWSSLRVEVWRRGEQTFSLAGGGSEVERSGTVGGPGGMVRLSLRRPSSAMRTTTGSRSTRLLSPGGASGDGDELPAASLSLPLFLLPARTTNLKGP
jgi:hypothetical protein